MVFEIKVFCLLLFFFNSASLPYIILSSHRLSALSRPQCWQDTGCRWSNSEIASDIVMQDVGGRPELSASVSSHAQFCLGAVEGTFNQS